MQTKAEAAGPMMGALRGVLDPWLGKPKWKQTEGRVTFVYRFDSEDAPPVALKLKVETNTREHFSVTASRRFPSRSRHAGLRARAISTPTNLTNSSAPKCALSTSARRVGTCSTWQLR